jgi:hypothetical protein
MPRIRNVHSTAVSCPCICRTAIGGGHFQYRSILPMECSIDFEPEVERRMCIATCEVHEQRTPRVSYNRLPLVKRPAKDRKGQFLLSTIAS